MLATNAAHTPINNNISAIPMSVRDDGWAAGMPRAVAAAGSRVLLADGWSRGALGRGIAVAGRGIGAAVTSHGDEQRCARGDNDENCNGFDTHDDTPVARARSSAAIARNI